MMNRELLRQRAMRQMGWAIAAATAILLFYGFLYFAEPFSDFWNNLLSNLLNVLSAALSAIVATVIWRQYEVSEPPRRIWGPFAAALWLWTVAEVIWGYFNMTVGEVNTGLPDVFWVSAYGLFAWALFAQFHLLFRPDPARARTRLVWVLAGVAALTALTVLLLSFFTGEASDLSAWVNGFYPAGDLAIGLAALALVRAYRQGALGYPWIGLLVFTAADLLYAWLAMSGAYDWSLENRSFISAIADLSYLAAYLTVAVGCFAQLLLLRYGPVFRRKSE